MIYLYLSLYFLFLYEFVKAWHLDTSADSTARIHAAFGSESRARLAAGDLWGWACCKRAQSLYLGRGGIWD